MIIYMIVINSLYLFWLLYRYSFGYESIGGSLFNMINLFNFIYFGFLLLSYFILHDDKNSIFFALSLCVIDSIICICYLLTFPI